MERTELSHDLYQDGFNAGFTLQAFMPTLAETFSLLETDDEYVRGIQDGREERLLEREAEQLAELREIVEEKDNDLHR